MLVKHFEKCSLCFGDGEVFGSHRSDCPRCKGDGMVEVTTEKNREVIQEFTQEILVSLEDSELHDAKVTRVDLALDFFNGMSRTLPQLLEDYKNGAFDVRGRRPGSKIAGDWGNDAERSLYVGCRKSGKETNIYEKGDQLFGREAKNPWVRIELRYGNKLRVLPVDILRRPADFFAGASDWHQLQLLQAGEIAQAQPCKQEKELPVQTVAAEVTRNVRWALTSAAPTIAAAFRFLDNDAFLELCDWRTKQLPGRLRKFKESDLATGFRQVMGMFSTAGAPCPNPV